MELLEIESLKPEINILQEYEWAKKNITLSILRLDKIHPVVSGNKIFKLHYYLREAVEKKQKIVTFGGAYSNHLAATATACRQYDLKGIGIVRGEKPEVLSPTLLYCQQENMHIEFVSRELYNKKQNHLFQQQLIAKFGEHILIPEGGFGHKGMQGAAHIYSHIAGKAYTHVCCATGTGTTLAGIITAAPEEVKVIGIDVLKNLDTEERLNFLLQKSLPENFISIRKYHFGGYAKKTNELLKFMNAFYKQYSIPLDFVYTGKMMFGITDLLKENYFPPDSNIICIHTGGLQGNTSLPKGTLTY